MVYIQVQHTVKDFDQWKAAFDENASARKAGGGTVKSDILEIWFIIDLHLKRVLDLGITI